MCVLVLCAGLGGVATELQLPCMHNFLFSFPCLPVLCQIYCGEKERKYVPVEERSNESASRLTAYSTGYSARRDAGMGIK